MQRKARPGVVVPIGLIEAEESNIRAAVAGWHARRPGRFDAEASHRLLEDYFLRMLQINDETIDAALVVELARSGHPPADRALRRFIQQAMELDQFQSLPTSVRDYGRRCVEIAPLAGYPSRVSQVVDTYMRDVAIVMLMHRVKDRWPAVPLLNSSGRASVAALVGPVFGVSERQARRIFQSDRGQARRLAEFLASRPNGGLPNGTGLKERSQR